MWKCVAKRILADNKKHRNDIFALINLLPRDVRRPFGYITYLFDCEWILLNGIR